MKSPTSIKSKIMIEVIPGMVIIFAILGYFLYWTVEQGLKNHSEQVLLVMASNIDNYLQLSEKKNFEDVVSVFDSVAIDEILVDGTILAISNLDFSKITVNANIPAEILIKNRPKIHKPFITELNVDSVASPIHVLYYPVGKNWIVLEHPTIISISGANVVGYVLFLFLPAIIILIGSILYFSLNKVLEPVSQAISTARSISTGNLQRRLKETGSKDEIDVLIRTFNELIERVDLGYKRMTQFTSNVAHELRTPITIIQGEIELAKKTAHTPEEDELLETVLEEIQYLSRVIENLLLLSRLENENIELEKFESRLAELINKVVKRYHKIRLQKNIDIKIAANCRRTVFVDRALIIELFSILLDNSIKYSHENTTITISLNCEEDYCHITFKDCCDGIPTGEEEKIFDRFYQINQVKPEPHSGSGLGLAIAKRIVTLHNGKIYVENETGHGCAFHVLLPLAIYD